ncbi:olfactory receptor 4K15-like isoform X1 [Arvicanthis niloticus]|uniref:olfactory receptor 4K15-like isoform X1 n=1 Tax=Arvicanthis niloticus TaxID=61156 RepID=UPI00402B303C
MHITYLSKGKTRSLHFSKFSGVNRITEHIKQHSCQDSVLFPHFCSEITEDNSLPMSMNETNYSRVTEFVLLGLSSSKELQPFLFLIFSLLYLAILLGNFLIILTVTSDSRLHTPMYFLLANLSFIDICVASFATPKMLADFLVEQKTISFEACLAQIFCVHLFAGGEMVLLVSMAYDRYVAICKPLHYMTIMNRHVCITLVIIPWFVGFIHTISQLAFTVNLPFCGPNQVDSFFCDLPLVTKLACTDTYVVSLLIVADSGVLTMSTFIFLVVSYTVILITVRNRSSASMAKARSTLTAHITVVILFFGPCIFIYAWPFNGYSVDKVLAVFYTIFTPILNPLIYTLRNKEVKAAMSKLRGRYLKPGQVSALIRNVLFL